MPPGEAAAARVDERDAVERLAQLTQQQARILQLVCEGKLNKQIAYELDIAETTVKAHLTAILRKLNVQSRTQAVLIAQNARFAAILHEGERSLVSSRETRGGASLDERHSAARRRRRPAVSICTAHAPVAGAVGRRCATCGGSAGGRGYSLVVLFVSPAGDLDAIAAGRRRDCFPDDAGGRLHHRRRDLERRLHRERDRRARLPRRATSPRARR